MKQDMMPNQQHQCTDHLNMMNFDDIF